MHTWESNNGTRYVAAGSYNELFAVVSGGTAYDIAPTDLTAGSEDAAVNIGYGYGFYRNGTYGTPRPDTGNLVAATTWSLDNWGEYLVACSTADGRILEWQLGTSSDAAVLSNAPTNNSGIIVTEERFIFALGAGANPRKVQWCDREDNTTWTPAATNEAGDIELQTSGQIETAIRTRGQTLIITDVDAHTARYIGPPYVYGFERVGSSCGIISRQAAADVDMGVFWMGSGGFLSALMVTWFLRYRVMFTTMCLATLTPHRKVKLGRLPMVSLAKSGGSTVRQIAQRLIAMWRLITKKTTG